MPENTLTPAQKFLRRPEILRSIPSGCEMVPAITVEDMEEYIRLLKEEWKEKAIDVISDSCMPWSEIISNIETLEL